ncbi:MAG: glycosyltransferase family 4 protein [Phycisphaerae bacterium]|nr:glycosyltransferase family 4 protein [Phycisphaerae bacterium]
MTKWKLLHVIGGNGSPGLLGQLGGQYRVLPEELIEQEIAAGESRTAKLLEREILRPVVRLGREFELNLTAARTLRKLMKHWSPDLVVCWDLEAIEQVRAALLGSRKHLPVAAMIFFQNDRHLASLQVASEFMDLTLVCGSDRLARWAGAKVPRCKGVHRIYPLFEKSRQVSDRLAFRQGMDLDPQSICVFVPIEGKLEDVFQGLVACGIVERIEPRLRIVISGFNRDRLDRCYHLAQKTIAKPILRIVEDWDIRSAIGACDYMVQVRGDFAESLHVIEAWGRSVPVVGNTFAEPAELLVADQTYRDAGKPMSRRFACGLYKLMNDAPLRTALIENTSRSIAQNCSQSIYRAQVIRLYQQLAQ